MNPFELYARQVGEFLSWKVRKDITKEILADLYGEFDVRRTNSGAKEERLIMKQIIAERGDPQELAAAFEERAMSLIGPKVYPAYRSALYVALTTSIVTVVAVTLGLWSFSRSGGWAIFFNVLVASVIVFSIVTAAFAVGERMGMKVSLPRSFASVSSSAAPGVSVGSMAFAAFILLLINVLPDYIGLPLIINGTSWHVQIFPILSPKFFGVPKTLLNIWCIVTVAVGGFGSSKFGRESIVKINLILRAFGIAVGVYILSAGNVFEVPSNVGALGIPQDLASAMVNVIAPNLFKMLLIALWFGLCVRTYYLIRDSLR
jgi:uncharacterized membrane protein